jgi:hypothetical protein
MCDFWSGGARNDRKRLGFYDTVVDTMGEWWIGVNDRKLLG